jgi:hypothetical protein
MIWLLNFRFEPLAANGLIQRLECVGAEVLEHPAGISRRLKHPGGIDESTHLSRDR